MPKTSRHHARELVLQGLYAAEVGKIPSDQVVNQIITDEELSETSLQFARYLFAQVHKNREWTDETISRLAANWELGRIAVIDRNILRIALTELKVMSDTPVKVVLNEAIELAKEYSTAESASFVNGILDSFIKNSPECSEV